ncbi:MAG: undecaprenyl/decaprenyl-phosphate alpha-N-acetylglucosaminyl 1-phosphate transferase [Anaerolineae bacterium]|nr:undecaprenyl/decaprenyl-phosphate alpha-N-acetylglucosaminyl 1-phosphate transferase [Anaerolineae bacterium]
MSSYIAVFSGVLLLAVLGTPLARKLGLRIEAVDQPDPTRKVHTVPTPRLGGVAIFASTLIVTLLLGGRYNLGQLTGILVGSTMVSLLGFFDDRFTMSPWAKLLGQLVAAGLVMSTGVHITSLPWDWLDYSVTLVWLIGITNAFNLLDNMDGLSGGIAAIAAGYFALMCSFSGQYLVGALSVAVMAACIGFLFYNWNPATIFMGDSGSLFLGFILATIGIKLAFPQNVTFVTWMIPILVLGVPIFDTTLVTISRLKRRLNPLTTPGKDHSSHRLTYAGLSSREAVLVLYILGFILGMVAIYVTQAGPLDGYLMGVITVSVGLYALWTMERKPFWPPG